MQLVDLFVAPAQAPGRVVWFQVAPAPALVSRPLGVAQNALSQSRLKTASWRRRHERERVVRVGMTPFVLKSANVPFRSQQGMNADRYTR